MALWFKTLSYDTQNRQENTSEKVPKHASSTKILILKWNTLV